VVSSRFFSSSALIRSRSVATIFCLDRRSRSCEADLGRAMCPVVFRERMIRTRNSS
jgi:hypothetical protein